MSRIKVPGDLGSWSIGEVKTFRYLCGFCDSFSGSSICLGAESGEDFVHFCSFCGLPTYVGLNAQIPGSRYGDSVDHLPNNISSLYDEVRDCMSVNSYTLAVLGCRKLLMNIAVNQGANENESFAYYVNYLEQNNYVPPNSRVWLDHVRQRGNEATHEIHRMDRADAEQLVSFIEMLLKIVYEFPNRIKP